MSAGGDDRRDPRPAMTAGWRAFRPAIWLAMLGIALALLINPPYIGVAVLGASIGIAARVAGRRRRRARHGQGG
jgi:hypothetical protein